jgi:porphobilinogen synthase
MPGQFRFSVDALLSDIGGTKGVSAVLLFGKSDEKSPSGKSAALAGGAVQQAIRAIKREFPGLAVITDVCLCAYTSHGHCGVVSSGKIDNDKTLEALGEIALSHAACGADLVAPSAMMDGQVKAIRSALDGAGFSETGILAYSAKYASNFYGPFRDALGSSPESGDRKKYQMDTRNSREALLEAGLDIEEGADMVMVKPALAYLDIIAKLKEKSRVPVAAYSVSGEYAMIKKYASGNADVERSLAIEILTSIKRAGADVIITYFAKEAAGWIN